jgi:8-oxo-dGTP pyrophosphatase MutT (NUDIX family)
MSAVRLAATVILARPPLEVYLTRRSSRSAFAPDAFVFPGGTIEPQDASDDARERTLGLETDRVARAFRAEIHDELPSDEAPVDEVGARALFVAALRELFEEAGVLLARTRGGDPVDAAVLASDAVTDQRSAVRNGELPFADFLRAHGWYADAGALALFSHWITPRSEHRRYNTHFFFATAPPGQAALADTVETHDGVWIAPARALERYRAGTMHLVYPTIKHLTRLAAFDTVERALEFALTKTVLTILPNDAGADFTIPAALEDAW